MSKKRIIELEDEVERLKDEIVHLTHPEFGSHIAIDPYFNKEREHSQWLRDVLEEAGIVITEDSEGITWRRK